MGGELTLRDGDVRFLIMEPSELHAAAVVARCLDPHWVPRTLLRRMLDRGESLADVAGDRLAAVRSEYLRALVNAPQVIVKRSSLYGSPALARDLLENGGDREALGSLLEQGAVVPFLGTESSPVAEPRRPVDGSAFTAWRRLCGQVQARCLRLSWADDSGNASSVQQLRRRFGWFAGGMHQLDVPALRRHLGLAADDEDAFGQRLAQVALWCAGWAGEGRSITRDDLYREFVVAGGSHPSEGRYDRGKPFAAEVKQLLDLQHGTNLPDALGRFVAAPAGTLQRQALQEWRLPRTGTAALAAGELARRIRAAAAPLIDSGPTVESFGELGLVDVEAIRRTEAWAAYVETLEHLLAAPLGFADPGRGAAALYERYVALVRVATSFAMRRSGGIRTERWVPVTELVVEAAGAALAVIPSLLGRDPAACRVAGRVSGRPRAARFTVRLVIRGLAERRSRADLTCGLHLFEGGLYDAREQWAELLAAFGLRGEGEPLAERLPAERAAVMERSGDGAA